MPGIKEVKKKDMHPWDFFARELQARLAQLKEIDRKYSQREICRRADIAESMISHITKNGGRPQPDTVRKLVAAINEIDSTPWDVQKAMAQAGYAPLKEYDESEMDEPTPGYSRSFIPLHNATKAGPHGIGSYSREGDIPFDSNMIAFRNMSKDDPDAVLIVTRFGDIDDTDIVIARFNRKIYLTWAHSARKAKATIIGRPVYKAILVRGLDSDDVIRHIPYIPSMSMGPISLEESLSESEVR